MSVIGEGTVFEQEQRMYDDSRDNDFNFPYDVAIGDGSRGSSGNDGSGDGDANDDDTDYGKSGGSIVQPPHTNPSRIYHKAFPLDAVGPNGVPATATVNVESGVLSIDITIDADKSIPFFKRRKPCHIHHGGCPSGSIAFNLTSIEPKNRGSGTMFNVINSQTPTYSYRYFLLNSRSKGKDDGINSVVYSIACHESEAALDNVLFCGKIGDFSPPGSV